MPISSLLLKHYGSIYRARKAKHLASLGSARSHKLRRDSKLLQTKHNLAISLVESKDLKKLKASSIMRTGIQRQLEYIASLRPVLEERGGVQTQDQTEGSSEMWPYCSDNKSLDILEFFAGALRADPKDDGIIGALMVPPMVPGLVDAASLATVDHCDTRVRLLIASCCTCGLIPVEVFFSYFGLPKPVKLPFSHVKVSSYLGVYACVRMDAFFTTIEEMHNPELRGIPFAVSNGSKLSSSNSIARKFGVLPYMPNHIGRRLCPQLTIIPRNMSLYEKELKKYKEALRWYDPWLLFEGADKAELDLLPFLVLRELGHSEIGGTQLPAETLKERQQCKYSEVAVDSVFDVLEHLPRLIEEASCLLKTIRTKLNGLSAVTCSGVIAPTRALARYISHTQESNEQVSCLLPSASLNQAPFLKRASDAMRVQSLIYDLGSVLKRREPEQWETFSALRALFYISHLQRYVLWPQKVGTISGVGKKTEELLLALGVKTLRDAWVKRYLLAILTREKLFQFLMEWCTGLHYRDASNSWYGLGIDRRIQAADSLSMVIGKGDNKSVSASRSFNSANDCSEQFFFLAQQLRKKLRERKLAYRQVTIDFKKSSGSSSYSKTLPRFVIIEDYSPSHKAPGGVVTDELYHAIKELLGRHTAGLKGCRFICLRLGKLIPVNKVAAVNVVVATRLTITNNQNKYSKKKHRKRTSCSIAYRTKNHNSLYYGYRSPGAEKKYHHADKTLDVKCNRSKMPRKVSANKIRYWLRKLK